MGTSYSAPDIYHRIRGGRGSSGFSASSSVAENQSDLQESINKQVVTLNGKMNAAWQGNASDQAVAGAAPLATASDSASTSLNQASGAMNNQVGAFHSAYNSVVEMPTAAPSNNIGNEIVSAFGVNTPLDQQISNYKSDGQHNVAVYSNYASESSSNAAEMPTDFGSLPNPHPTISVVGASGGGSGGATFTGSAGPVGGGSGSTGGVDLPRSLGGGGYVPTGFNAGGDPAGAPPPGPGTSTELSWDLPGGPGGGLPGGGLGMGPGGSGPGFTEPGTFSNGGFPNGEDEFPGGGGPNFLDEDGFPIGGLPNGSGRNQDEGFLPGRLGGANEFGGPNGFGGSGPGGFGGAGGSGGSGGFGGPGGSGGASGTGSASAGGPGNSSGVGATPGAEEAALRGPGGMMGAPGEPGGMGPMGGGGGRKGEEDKEHKTAEYLQEADPDALFGSDQLTVPPVIGAE
jgi:hypothetical protein